MNTDFLYHHEEESAQGTKLLQKWEKECENIAKEASGLWAEVRDSLRDNPEELSLICAGSPDLARIVEARTESNKSVFQDYLEGQVKFIELSYPDDDGKIAGYRRLQIDLIKILNKILQIRDEMIMNNTLKVNIGIAKRVGAIRKQLARLGKI